MKKGNETQRKCDMQFRLKIEKKYSKLWTLALTLGLKKLSLQTAKQSTLFFSLEIQFFISSKLTFLAFLSRRRYRFLCLLVFRLPFLPLQTQSDNKMTANTICCQIPISACRHVLNWKRRGIQTKRKRERDVCMKSFNQCIVLSELSCPVPSCADWMKHIKKSEIIGNTPEKFVCPRTLW